MKAEHRKELGTNVLADYLGTALQHAKEGPSQKTLIYGGIVLLVVALIATFWYFSTRSKANDSARWEEWGALTVKTRFDVEDKELAKLKEKYPGTDPETLKRLYELDKFEAANSGTTQARLARFQKARLLMRKTEGLGSFFRDLREDAKLRIKAGGELYEKLSDESGDVPALAQEALFNAGKANEDLGDFNRAKQYYEKLKKDHPKCLYVPAADKALARLNDEKVAAELKNVATKE
jgi:hypothetical protein